MNPQPLDPRLLEELKDALERGLTSGDYVSISSVMRATHRD
jgi:hypothetical protein